MKVNPDNCDGCEECVSACPAGAITIKNDKAVINADLCVDCGICLEECPNNAVEFE